MSIYFQILYFAIKNKLIIEFLKLRLNKTSDKWKKKRKKEYIEKSLNFNDCITKLFPDKNIDLTILEPINSHIDSFVKLKKTLKPNTKENPYTLESGLGPSTRSLVFYLCYFSKPNIVVETGVADGFSSSYILYALSLINKGKLVSFESIFMPWHTKEMIGSAIPKDLKKNQTLILHKGVDKLEKFLKTTQSIDIFIHDSQHTYDHMMSEFLIAWPYVKKDGYLCADDVSENDAFLDFCDKIQRIPIISTKENNRHFGIIKK